MLPRLAPVTLLVMRLNERETWLFTGDSITQGIHHTHGRRGWVELFAEQVRWVEGRMLDVVVNTGCSGWNTREVLAEFDHLVGRWNATVVGISLGTNDAFVSPDEPAVTVEEFRADLVELVTRTQDTGARTIVQTPALITPSALARRPSLPAYAQVCREVAQATGSLLVDHEAHWRDRFGEADAVEWLDDPIHPNAEGHVAMAGLLLETVGFRRWTDGPLPD